MVGGHRKHSDGGYSDTSSGGSFLDENDREVSNLTDRAFRSLCIGDEAVYNDSDLCLSSPCTQRDRQMAFSHDRDRGDKEREELKRAAHENFSLRVQQYGQDWIHGGMYGAEIHRDPQWDVYGERTQGRISATFQNSFVETCQQEKSLREEQLSFLSNGASELSSQQHRSRSRVSSLIRAFNSDGHRDVAGMDDKVREWNDEASWDKSALMSIQQELSEFSTSYQQNFHSGHFPSAGSFSSRDANFYSSEVAEVAHMSHNSASSFMRSSHSKHSMSAQVNCNSNFFIHSEFSPFRVWRDHNRFPFQRGEMSGFMHCSEFPKWSNMAPVVPPNPPRSTSTSTMLQKASAVEKRCESELAGHYPHRKRSQSLGANRLPSQRRSTASPTIEMSRRVRDTISSVKALQQKIKMMSEQNITAGVIENQQGVLYSHENMIPFGNNPVAVAPNVNTSTTPFNISQLLTPLVHSHQEAVTSDFQPYGVSPLPVEHAPVRAESRGATPDVRMSSYKSRATSLLFNLKDNRKRVKSTYSPPKFKGLETNKQQFIQEPQETVIDMPDFPEPEIQFLQLEESGRTNAAVNQYHNPGLPYTMLDSQPAAAHTGQYPERAKLREEEKRKREEEERRRMKKQQEERAAQEEQRKRAAQKEQMRVQDEQKRRAVQEEQQRRATLEEQQRRAAQEEQQRRAALEEQQRRAAQEEQQRRATLEEQQRRAAQEEQQRRATLEEQQRRAAQEEQQRRAALEEQQRRAAQEEQQRRAALEEQQRRAAQEEQQRRAAQEEQQRRAAQEEQQRRIQEEQKRRAAHEEQQRRAALEEQQRRAAQEEEQRRAAQEEQQRRAQEEQKRRAALEEQQRRAGEEEQQRKIQEEQKRRATQEEQQRRAAQEEQKRRAGEEEKQMRAAQEEQQRRAVQEEQQRRVQEELKRRAALEEQKRRAAQEEQQRQDSLDEEQRRVKQADKIRKEEKIAYISEAERFKHIQAQKKAEQQIEEQRREHQKKEEWMKTQREEEKKKAVEKVLKQREEKQVKEERIRLLDKSQAPPKEEKRAAPEVMLSKTEDEIQAKKREEEMFAAQRENVRAAQMEKQNRAAQMDTLQYYAITSRESERTSRERQILSPLPPQQRSNPSGLESTNDSQTRHYRPHASPSPAPSLPRSTTSSPALGAKPSMFRVKDNTIRGSSLTKSVKPRFHKNFGEDFWMGSPVGSERGEEEQETMRHSAGTPVHPDAGFNRLAAINESSTFQSASSSLDYSAHIPHHRPYSRRSIAMDEDDSRSVISNMSEDVESFATSAADLADIRGLYDSERPESACSFSSDVSRSMGKPPAVPPKSEKALRRAKRLTSRRINKELSKVAENNPAGLEKDVSSIPSSSSFEVRSSNPHATATVSLPTVSPNITVPASQAITPKTVAHVPSSPTLHRANHPAPVTQYQVESSYPQSYPVTQRKVLQDLGSGQYFVVDVPVPVKTKTFFDPETGKYVQLNVRESGQSISQPQPQHQPQMQIKPQQQPLPQTSPAGKPFGFYQGYNGYPQGYQPAAVNSVHSQRSSVPATLHQEQQPVRESHNYGYPAPEIGQNSEVHRYSPEKNPYMDTVNDKDKTYNRVYNTHGSYESFPECDTNSQLAGSSICENDNSAPSQYQSRDIITMSELEDFMDASDW
uniref:DUF4585 domain-containing protein n=1 Tax=Amphiprion ocellaris TaxID=80972 RepID=A0AAQ5YRK0_AMPOC